jgi:hypothetical protein
MYNDGIFTPVAVIIVYPGRPVQVIRFSIVGYITETNVLL